MPVCWVCKKETKQQGLIAICKGCHNEYSLIQTIRKLTPTEIEDKVAKMRRRIVLHEAVLANYNEKPKVIIRSVQGDSNVL